MGSGKVEGGIKCVKWLMWFFNFIFFIVGLALIIVGAVIQLKFKEYVEVLGKAFNFAPIVIIIVGAIIFFVAFFGCCGAWKENYCMVMTFAFLMVLILILELAAAIGGFIMKAKIKEIIKPPLTKALKSYDKKTEYKNVIDAMQQQFKCCGVNDSSDYRAAGIDIPSSCCENLKVCSSPPTKGQIFSGGCMTKFGQWVEGNVAVVAGVALGFCFLQLVGILFACCLGRAIKKEYEVV